MRIPLLIPDRSPDRSPASSHARLGVNSKAYAHFRALSIRAISGIGIATMLAGCPKHEEAPPMIVEATPQPAPPTKPWPETAKREVVNTVHGTAIKDNFQWLEDEKAPDVQAWMKAQDSYTRSELAKAPGREALVKRFTDLFYVDSVGAPVQAGKRLFYMKTGAKQERAVLYVKDTAEAAERVLLDPNGWGPTSLGGWVPSQDGKRLAYMKNPNHADEAVMYVLDVESGADLPDVIPGAKYAEPDWVPDGSGFYYEWLPTDLRSPSTRAPATPRSGTTSLAPIPRKTASYAKRPETQRRFSRPPCPETAAGTSSTCSMDGAPSTCTCRTSRAAKVLSPWWSASRTSTT